ncbi:MAG: hypothetical protein A2142_02130 [candidate division Zixibacteria bacterium RBG_16_48_11]|nr:MAG: hypothetical protein A2142_02130 [candidate division Zixibacteria bacterium RBG_16_48_11]
MAKTYEGGKMQKKLFSAVGLFVVLFLVSSSQAQFLGQLSTAQSPGPGNSLLGGYFGIYEDAFSFFGQYRYGFANYLDGAIKLGVINVDVRNSGDKAGLLLGGDIKYQLLDAVLGDPFDLAIGGGTEFTAVEDLTIFSLGGNLVGSYPFEMRNGKHISPYARFNLRMQRREVNTNTETDLKAGLNLGTQLELGQSWNLLGEFFIEDQIGFVLGFNYKL